MIILSQIQILSEANKNFNKLKFHIRIDNIACLALFILYYIYIYIIYIYIYISIYLSICYLSIYLSIYLNAYVCMYVYVDGWMCVSFVPRPIRILISTYKYIYTFSKKFINLFIFIDIVIITNCKFFPSCTKLVWWLYVLFRLCVMFIDR